MVVVMAFAQHRGLFAPAFGVDRAGAQAQVVFQRAFVGFAEVFDCAIGLDTALAQRVFEVAVDPADA